MEAAGASQRESQSVLFQDFAPEAIPETILNDTNNGPLPKRLIISVDFGTTYSCVSYVALEEGEAPEYLELDRIECIQNFPDDCNSSSNPMEPMRRQVPTEVMYPQNRKFRREEDLEELANGEGGNDNEATAPVNQDISFMEIEQDDEEIDLDELMSENLNRFRWGYSVHESWGLPITHSNPNNKPLSRFKLLLDSSATTQTVRDDLRGTLDSLKRRKIISKPLQVIADFLTYLLRHTRSELLGRGYDDSWKTEMVLCVPAIWSQKACRGMQTAMAIGMEKAMLGRADVQNNSIEHLFIVSEPEAAAAYALARDPSSKPGDTFVLLDAGGGTVDANTYTISLTTPLRLRSEVVEPGGGLFGSSYLNERFRKLLKDLLRDERYLENGAETIDGIIESIIMRFEYVVKRSFDCFISKTGVKQFPISGLRDNSAKLFRDGCLHVPVSKITAIFMELLQGIASIMEEQINKALQKGCRVEKVILIGGFAASQSLKKYLEQRLDAFSKSHNYRIILRRPENTSTAVASGGVLRAFNKRQGPERQARSSYGILRTEPFYRRHDEPRNRPEYEGLRPFWDPDDGMPYIKDTVDWVLKLGDPVPPVWYCRPFACSHTIRAWPPRPLICKEVLYVSDRSTRSHYKLNHPNNEGAEKIGEIVVDFTFLRDRGLIHPIDPVTDENTGKTTGRRHYRVNYTMVIRVVDRDLQCYAIYNGETIQTCKINIAPAFKPGVK